MIKPGIHWDAVHLICHRILVKGFQRLGIFKSPSASSLSSTAPANDGVWNSEHDEEKILASGISSAFFPHGLGHSLGMDVHDVPSASKPAVNPTVNKGLTIGHESFYTYLRLRLPLQKNMIVVSAFGVQLVSFVLMILCFSLDGRAGLLFLTTSHCSCSTVETY